MITTSNDEILLFGGFGGISSEGQYLNDIWVFSTASHCWSNIETTGEIP